MQRNLQKGHARETPMDIMHCSVIKFTMVFSLGGDTQHTPAAPGSHRSISQDLLVKKTPYINSANRYFEKDPVFWIFRENWVEQLECHLTHECQYRGGIVITYREVSVTHTHRHARVRTHTQTLSFTVIMLFASLSFCLSIWKTMLSLFKKCFNYPSRLKSSDATYPADVML